MEDLQYRFGHRTLALAKRVQRELYERLFREESVEDTGPLLETARELFGRVDQQVDGNR